MQHFALVLFFSIFLVSQGEEEIQKLFKDIDGTLAPLRDECLKENSLTISDLKGYEKADDIPENQLCFYRCFYRKIGFLDENGKVVIEAIDVLTTALDVDKDKTEELTKCVKEIDDIPTCADMKIFDKCFDKVD